MRKTGILALVLIAFFSAALYLASCRLVKEQAVSLDVAEAPYKTLSEYHFFAGDDHLLQPNDRVIPYELATPLFTDYAFKSRFVYVPEGKKGKYHAEEVLKLPVGSCLIKSFYYPADFRKPEAERRIIETRLLVHRESGWEALDYVWNDEQTEAVLENAGDIKEVSWTHFDGTNKKIDYVIPNKNQCKGCHWYDNAMSPIGPKARNLNCEISYAEGKANQLDKWSALGLVEGIPAASGRPKGIVWTDDKKFSLDERARAYLDVNCGHCHNPKGPAYTTGLYLHTQNDNPEHLGICKAPVAAGKATGGFLYDIVPGHPERSILSYRLASLDPGIKMPEVGRVMVHEEGLALLNEWITEMKGDTCTRP